ncbi:MAG: hypothetical protein WCT05_16575 [Lentisphaeria bacterium]
MDEIVKYSMAVRCECKGCPYYGHPLGELKITIVGETVSICSSFADAMNRHCHGVVKRYPIVESSIREIIALCGR